MRPAVICTGVLGGGTALVFAAAALTSAILPAGQVVPQTMNAIGWGPQPAFGGPVRVMAQDGGQVVIGTVTVGAAPATAPAPFGGTP